MVMNILGIFNYFKKTIKLAIWNQIHLIQISYKTQKTSLIRYSNIKVWVPMNLANRVTT